MAGVLQLLFAALAAYRVALSDATILDTGAGADAGFQLTSAGVANAINSGGTTSIETYVLPGSSAALLYVRATLNSGSLDAGTTGSWLALSTSRTWSTGAGNAANLTIEIASDAAGANVLDSATIDLDATGA